jgi:hypothetical protein
MNYELRSSSNELRDEATSYNLVTTRYNIEAMSQEMSDIKSCLHWLMIGQYTPAPQYDCVVD